jgi:hypothetical protein
MTAIAIAKALGVAWVALSAMVAACCLLRVLRTEDDREDEDEDDREDVGHCRKGG